MDRTMLSAAGLFGALAVAAGAFGAHALRARLTPDDLAIFETGARYHLIHAAVLFGIALALAQWPQDRGLAIGGWLIGTGTIVFSGSLYVLVLTGQRWLGAVTPLGGLLLIAGWLAVAWSGLSHRGP
jgi:uncharacterized membrane protein YgdD (TMEM256/DUF423 family)